MKYDAWKEGKLQAVKVGSNFRKRETGNREVRDKIAVIWQKGLVI